MIILWAMQNSLISILTFLSPRSQKRQNPKLRLMFPLATMTVQLTARTSFSFVNALLHLIAGRRDHFHRFFITHRLAGRADKLIPIAPRLNRLCSVEIAPAFKPGTTKNPKEKNRALAQCQRAFGLKPGSGSLLDPRAEARGYSGAAMTSGQPCLGYSRY